MNGAVQFNKRRILSIYRFKRCNCSKWLHLLISSIFSFQPVIRPIPLFIDLRISFRKRKGNLMLYISPQSGKNRNRHKNEQNDQNGVQNLIFHIDLIFILIILQRSSPYLIWTLNRHDLIVIIYLLFIIFT